MKKLISFLAVVMVVSSQAESAFADQHYAEFVNLLSKNRISINGYEYLAWGSYDAAETTFAGLYVNYQYANAQCKTEALSSKSKMEITVDTSQGYRFAYSIDRVEQCENASYRFVKCDRNSGTCEVSDKVGHFTNYIHWTPSDLTLASYGKNFTQVRIKSTHPNILSIPHLQTRVRLFDPTGERDVVKISERLVQFDF